MTDGLSRASAVSPYCTRGKSHSACNYLKVPGTCSKFPPNVLHCVHAWSCCVVERNVDASKIVLMCWSRNATQQIFHKFLNRLFYSNQSLHQRVYPTVSYGSWQHCGAGQRSRGDQAISKSNRQRNARLYFSSDNSSTHSHAHSTRIQCKTSKRGTVSGVHECVPFTKGVLRIEKCFEAKTTHSSW